MIPQEIINEYNLQDIVDSDGWCYAEIRKAVYGLIEIGFIANQELKIVLAKAGYAPTRFTPGLYTHKTRPIAFSLVVDDFVYNSSKRKECHVCQIVLIRFSPNLGLMLHFLVLIQMMVIPPSDGMSCVKSLSLFLLHTLLL
jgi:hypothetical protein